MASVPLNLTIEQGADFQINLTVRNKDGTPLNLLGYTASSNLRKHYSSTTSYPFIVTFIDRINGRISLEMTDSVTANLTEGRYVYDIYIESGNGKKTKVVHGMAIVSPGVSF
jgi:hypothetical protein